LRCIIALVIRLMVHVLSQGLGSQLVLSVDWFEICKLLVVWSATPVCMQHVNESEAVVSPVLVSRNRGTLSWPEVVLWQGCRAYCCGAKEQAVAACVQCWCMRCITI
jgi:hypothetical protein